MHQSELGYAQTIMRSAECLEDVFGASPDVQQIAKNYRLLAKCFHPDRYTAAGDDERQCAEDAFKLLTSYYEKARSCAERGIYGKRLPLHKQMEPVRPLFSMRINGTAYQADTLFAEGEVSNVYTGTAHPPDGEKIRIVMKISFGDTASERHANNAFIRREAETLQALYRDSSDSNLVHLPRHLAHFQTDERALGSILTFCEGYDCYEIRRNPNHVNGVEAKHLFWILSRCLTTLGYVHGRGFIHGNIEPGHIIVNPPNHNVCLIDWCYSLREHEVFRAFVPEFSSPEVRDRSTPTPSSDLYSLGKSLLFLAGDEAAQQRLPIELLKLMQWMTLPSIIQRPRDALELNRYLMDIRSKIYGQHGFVVFPY